MSLLLTSVFRPFGVDDAYGRKENKLELFHNQVTREQGIFSLRYNHLSFGLYFLAENVRKPAVVLDFPTLKQFRREVEKGYDYVGISFITPNFAKAKRMAEIVREVSPSTKIVLGGHGTRIPDVETLIENDYVVKGEGIRALRELFGEDVDAPIRHPALRSAVNKKILGLPFRGSSGMLAPGVGCPNACRFCCTSHFFDRTYTPFFKTGRELFDTLVDLSGRLKTDDFFVMDENFLKHKGRAMELLDLMEQEGRPFNFSIFSSAEAVADFGVENMVRLGVQYLWIGAESKKDVFQKNKGIDLRETIAELKRHGILVLASSILFLEHHDKTTIWEDVDYAIGLEPTFTQFMQLGPLPQTKLYLDYKKQGRLREDVPYEEWHGQHRLWFDHPHFTAEESESYLREAFRKEFETLGPSILRVGETMAQGLDAPAFQGADPFMRKRYENLRARCAAYYYTLFALKWLAPTRRMKEQGNRTIALYRRRLGAAMPWHWAASAAVYALANAMKIKLALGREAHNPKTVKTMHRLQPRAYKEMKGWIQALVWNRKTWAILEKDRSGAFELSLHFSGKIRGRTVGKVLRRLNERSSLSLNVIRINVTPLAKFNEAAFEAFLNKLSNKCEDIRIYCLESQKRNAAFFNRMARKFGGSVSIYS